MTDPTTATKDDGIVKRVSRVSGATLLGMVLLAILTLFLAAIIYGVFFTDAGRQVLDNLREHAYARGVITFLIAVATITVALVLVVAVLSGIGQDKAAERFNHGREVLSLLIGVLGTVVGFYFGASTAGPEPPSVSPPIFELADAQGEFTAFVTGGEAPYRYTLVFEPSGIPPIEDATTDGWINEVVDVGQNQEVTFTLHVTDAAGRFVEVEGQVGTSP